MIAVLGASAAIEVVLQGEKSPAIVKYLKDSDWVTAPSLYISEVTNIFWKYYSFKNLTMEQCENGTENAIALPDEFFDDTELYREAFAMGCITGKPVYDMFYFVLARRNNGVLLTMDKSLQSIAKSNSVKTLELG